MDAKINLQWAVVFALALSTPPAVTMSAREMMTRNLLIFCKVVLKHAMLPQLSLPSQSYTQTSPPSSCPLIATRITAHPPFPSPLSSPSLIPFLIPALGEAQTTLQPHHRALPMLASSRPAIKTLALDSLHKHFSTSTAPSLNNMLLFPGTCHRSAYFVFFPDPAADLVLDLTQHFESIFRSDDNGFHQDPEDALDDILNIYLYEEDEPPPKRIWTLTISRPLDSMDLPKPKMRSDRGRRHVLDISGIASVDSDGGRCRGTSENGGTQRMAWKLGRDSELGLRHWVMALRSSTNGLLGRDLSASENAGWD